MKWYLTSRSIPQVDPLDDIDVINLELALADLEVIAKRLERLKKGEAGKEAQLGCRCKYQILEGQLGLARR